MTINYLPEEDRELYNYLDPLQNKKSGRQEPLQTLYLITDYMATMS